jgi:hypothetical protein
MSLTLVSDDSRRSLYEFGQGEWKCAKYLEIKEDSVIGDHYHKLKDEYFLLVSGEIEELIMNDGIGPVMKSIRPPFAFAVPRWTYHKFKVKAGSILIGLQSELYDKTDDYVS